MHNLYIMWFLICDLLYAKLYLFVFDATLLHRIGKLLASVAALLVASFFGDFRHPWLNG